MALVLGFADGKKSALPAKAKSVSAAQVVVVAAAADVVGTVALSFS